MKKIITLSLIMILPSFYNNLYANPSETVPNDYALQQKKDLQNTQNTSSKNFPPNVKWQNAKISIKKLLGDHPSDSMLNSFLKGGVDGVNKRLPRDLGDGVVMTKVAVYDKTLTYDINVKDSLKDAPTSEKMKSTMIQNLDMCEEFDTLFQYGIKAIYRYHTTDDKIITVAITPKDCGF